MVFGKEWPAGVERPREDADGTIATAAQAQASATPDDLVYVPPVIGRRWPRLRKGFALLERERDRVAFAHPEFGDAVNVVYMDATHTMHVFLGEYGPRTQTEEDADDPASRANHIGSVYYPRRHIYPRGAWTCDDKLQEFFGGYYRDPHLDVYGNDGNDRGASGFRVRNFWPASTIDDPLGMAIYKLVEAQCYWKLRYGKL